KKLIYRYLEVTDQKTVNAKESADSFFQDIPDLSQHHWERLLQFRHLFFYVSLNALAFGSRQLRRTWCNHFGRGRSCLRRCGWSRSRLCASRRRRSGADQPVRKTCRCSFSVRSAE